MAIRLFGRLFVPVFFLAACVTCPADPSPPLPHTVTLQLKKLQLSKVLADLNDQTGILVKDEREDGDPTLSLDLRDASFWKAVDTIAQSVEARVLIQPRDRKIVLVKRSRDDQTKVSYSGPFRIALRRISVSRDLESGSHQASGVVEVAWEPSLQPFYLETRPQDLLIKDDRGEPITGAGQGSSLAPVDGRIALLFDIQLPAPQRSVSRLGLIEGRFKAIVPSRMLAFRFASLDQLEKSSADAPIRQQKEEEITCRISKLTLEKDRWTIQVALDTPPGASQLDTYQSWLVNNEMVLVSKDGTRRMTSSSEVAESVNDRRALVSYNFTDRDGRLRGKPEDWTLIYTGPAGVVVMPIPFRFTEIPLP